jgi:FkbM family methyltransferase
MIFEGFANWLNKRRYRSTNRRILKQWWDDGGDARFRYDYPLNQDSFVIDLGGYEGEWTSDIYAKYGCRITVFEPVERFASAIAERFRENDSIKVLQFGLGAVTESQTIFLRGAGSSTVRRRAEAESIRIVDVKDWFDENDVDSVALMKINIEGGEYDLLDRMIDTELVQRIENLQVQFHNFTVDASRRMERIQQALQRTHSLTYQYRFVWENWARKSDA